MTADGAEGRKTRKTMKMKTGMTLRQFAVHEFWSALAEYEKALKTGVNIVGASLRIHMAKAGVPKSYWPLVNRKFKETTRQNQPKPNTNQHENQIV